MTARWDARGSQVHTPDGDVVIVAFTPNDADASSPAVAARVAAVLNDDDRARRLLPKARAAFDWIGAPLALVALVIHSHRPGVAACLAGVVVGVAVGSWATWRNVDGKAYDAEKKDERVAAAVDTAMKVAHEAQQIDMANAVYQTLYSGETAVVSERCHWCPATTTSLIVVGVGEEAVRVWACAEHVSAARLGDVRPRSTGETPVVDTEPAPAEPPAAPVTTNGDEPHPEPSDSELWSFMVEAGADGGW